MTARKQSLDVLRGAAIILVIVHHYGLPENWVSFGWSGVDLFFVLSGFLIARLLFTEYQESGGIKLKRFWIRRGFKIYPAFYAHMLFIMLVLILLGYGLPRKILSDLFFLQDYIRPVADHGWSLGVEEKFYLFLPLLMIGLIRVSKSMGALPYIYVGLLVGCLLMRYFTLGGSVLR